MSAITITIDSQRLNEALQRFPGLIEQRVDGALNRGAQELARAAKLAAPKARSTLVNSIIARRLGKMHFEVTTGVNYARAVEEGTGPAAGKSKYMPNPIFLEDWVKQRGFGLRLGIPETDLRSRAFALAVYIRKHGTRPHPFMRPARDRMEPRIHALVEGAVDAAVNEAGA